MTIGVAHARSAGTKVLVCASTGHAGRSLARLAREAELPTHILLPEAASPDRIAAIAAEGARVYRVRGSYAQCRAAAAAAAAAHDGWADLTPAAHPYLAEGFATCGLEILEEAGDTRPDWVFLPVGEGILVSGLWKGLRHGRALGFLERMPPKLLGVQADGASGIAEAFWNMTDLVPIEAGPAPESIRIGDPAGWRRALEAIHDSAGNMAVVEAGEIESAREVLRQTLEIEVDDAAAAALAGVRRAAEEGTILLMDTAVVVLTAAVFPTATGTVEAPLVSGDPGELEKTG